MSMIEKQWVRTGTGFHLKLTFVRFNLIQRIEHIVLMVSMAILALSGLPQKFHDEAWARVIMKLLGGIEGTRVLHHAAAITLATIAAWDVLYIGYLVLSRRSHLSMLPQFKDVTDALAMIRYFLGLSEERPQFDRFSYAEKIEYWAMIWGTLVMGVTGLVLWFPERATHYLPGVFVPLAKTVHGWEAVLAVLALLVWHTWGVHLGEFNTSIFTGRLSEEKMLEEHPLEYARLKDEIAAIRLEENEGRNRWHLSSR